MHPVHSPNISKSEKRTLWDEIIKDFLSSNQTYRQYSEEHALKAEHLRYYVNAYKQKQRTDTASFIAIGQPTTSNQAKMQIQLKSLTLSLPISTPSASLQPLLQMLMSLC